MIDDNVLLGTMSQDLTTGCMRLFYPGFNQAGLRTITVKSYEAKIDVIEK